MKLQDRLPDSITVSGRRYKADFDFRNVLRYMDALTNEEIIPGAREYVALRCLMRRPPKDTLQAVIAVRKLLFSDSAPVQQTQRIMDYVQDADLIRAAFMQEYGINLWRDRLHWLEFIGLLSGLPGDNRFSEILSIRGRPIPAPTKYNADERKWLLKAKALYGIKLSEKEREDKLQASMRRTMESLMTLVKRGEGNA